MYLYFSTVPLIVMFLKVFSPIFHPALYILNDLLLYAEAEEDGCSDIADSHIHNNMIQFTTQAKRCRACNHGLYTVFTSKLEILAQYP
jgi:hypothetical protein